MKSKRTRLAARVASDFNSPLRVTKTRLTSAKGCISLVLVPIVSLVHFFPGESVNTGVEEVAGEDSGSEVSIGKELE